MDARLLAALLVPAIALADEPPPPPAEQAPPPAIDFHLPESVTPVEDPRPARFVMERGNVVVGRRVGEDAEFVWIVLDGQLARVRKTEISSMDYRIDQPAVAAPVVSPSPSAPPPLSAARESYRPLPEHEKPRGRGLVIWGGILMGVSYSLCVIGALNQPGDSGALLVIPLVGPALYATTDDAVDDDVGLWVGLSLVQAAGALMLYFGVRRITERPTPRRREFLGLLPTVGPRGAALWATGTF